MSISEEQRAHDLAIQFTKEYFDSEISQFNYRKSESTKNGVEFKEEQPVIDTSVWFEAYANFYRDFLSLLEEP